MVINGPIVDADSHVEEPDEIWDHLDGRYHSRRPQMVNLQGVPGVTDIDVCWLIDGSLYPKPFGNGASIAGTPVTSTFARRKPYDPGSQTLSDPDARVRDLDRAGIDLQVNFPTLMNERLTDDPQFEAALIGAYNHWAADRCGRHPSRLKWAAILPLRTPDRAVAEVRRVRDLGAACLATAGKNGELMLHDPVFDPVWAECERLNMPVVVHISFYHPAIPQSADTVFAANVIAGTVPVFFGFHSFVGAGLLDRFPSLRVGFFEAGADWLPYLIQRMDHYYNAGKRFPWFGVPRRRPSDYLKDGNVFVCTEGEEEGLPQVIRWLGEDQILIGADMPHAEARENALAEITERTDIPESTKRKILSDNPVRFFGL